MTDEVIDLENQRIIYDYILDNPMSHLRKISRDLNMPLSTLRYHIDFLEKKGVVVGLREMNLKVYSIDGKLSAEDKVTAPLVRQKRFRDIILVVITAPGLTHSEISGRLSIKASTLSKYIKIIEDRRIMYHKKIGREKHYYVFDERKIVELLLRYKRSFWDSFVDNALEIYFDR